ncbi:putative NHN endonuclease [uncultured Caudovirales phage]|uniref:Putative NHN endonuclease n=1 Tax=uncultured Caudovirales phage TaxID=2100421 RepID=A0A6J7WIQ6_9CAUD|nr:putative NHN endonuclease [uncultured Caudovirales phage]
MEYPSTMQLKQMFDYHSDGYLIWKIKPAFRVKIGDKAGSINSQGYVQISQKKSKFKAHRLIWLWHGYQLDDEIDHIDGNKLNNQIENLRAVKKSQNQWNAKIRKDNLSGIKGVRWHKRDCKWTASIRLHGKTKSLGYYNDLELAKLVIHEARSLYHGEYARNQ